MTAPRAIAFDVIETLFPLGPVQARLAEVGLSEDDLDAFFASLLRDAFALNTCGLYRPFKAVASSALGQMGVPEDRHDTVFEAFGELDAHPDVRPAFEALNTRGIPVICLTNGHPDVTRKLLDRNGLSDLVSRVISIDEIETWKPHAKVYTYTANAMDLSPQDLALVACHAWDCQGALSAGLQSGYVNRGKPYASAMESPQVIGDKLTEVVEGLLAL